MKKIFSTFAPYFVGSFLFAASNAFAGAEVQVNPGTTQFGDVLVGQTAGPETIIITNTGDAPLNISHILLRGRDSEEYSVASGTTCPMSGGTLGIGASCEIKVTFSPTSIGLKKALFKIISDGDPSPSYAYLRGTGTSPDAELTPTSYDFGNVWMEGPYQVATFTLQNTGNAELTVNGIHLRGADASNFRFINGTDVCPYGSAFSLAAGDECKIYVEYHPVAVGRQKAVIKVYTNDTDSPKLYSKLKGVGRSINEPDIDICEFSEPADFGEVSECEEYPITHMIEFKNNGVMDLHIKKVVLRGRDEGNFSIVNDMCTGQTLASGEVCDVYVELNPLSTGFKKAVLKVISNDPDENPYIVHLRAKITECRYY